MNKPEKMTVVDLMQEALFQQFDVGEDDEAMLRNALVEFVRTDVKIQNEIRRIVRG